MIGQVRSLNNNNQYNSELFVHARVRVYIAYSSEQRRHIFKFNRKKENIIYDNITYFWPKYKRVSDRGVLKFKNKIHNNSCGVDARKVHNPELAGEIIKTNFAIHPLLLPVGKKYSKFKAAHKRN